MNPAVNKTPLRMNSKLMQVTAIKKPTKAKFFKDFKVGTCFSVNMDVVDPGHGCGVYASYVEIINHATDEKCKRSLSELANRLEHFDFEEQWG